MIWESNLVIFPSLLSVAMVILNWNLASVDLSPLFSPSKFCNSCAVCSQAKILIIQIFLLLLFFYLAVSFEVKLKLSSFNLPFLFLALERLCSINFLNHISDKHRLGEKQEKKAQLNQKDPNVSECHENLFIIVTAEVSIQVAKSISSLASKCSCNSSSQQCSELIWWGAFSYFWHGWTVAAVNAGNSGNWIKYLCSY